MARRRAARARSQATARKRRNQLILTTATAAVIAVIALIVLGGVLRDDGDGAGNGVERTSQRAGRVLGEQTAGVVLTMWEDFQCPFCRKANDSVVARIVQDYVNTGRVQLHFRHFAFLGQESVWAAEAAECAAEQNRFWDYEEELFKRQRGENVGTYKKDKLKEAAATIGLDADAFNACLDTDRYKAQVQAELAEGKRLGVDSTPSFFLEGRMLPPEVWGDYAAFAAALDNALKVGR